MSRRLSAPTRTATAGKRSDFSRKERKVHKGLEGSATCRCPVLDCLPTCGLLRRNGARPARNGRFARPCDRSPYTYMSSGRSPARLVSFSRVPLRWRRRSKPRMAPPGAGLTAHAFVSPFGEKRGSSRAQHPPSAARYFVGGIPPSRLARVRWRITRTVVAPFPCARSSHMPR